MDAMRRRPVRAVRILHAEDVDDHVIRQGEDLGIQDLMPFRSQHAGELVNRPEPPAATSAAVSTNSILSASGLPTCRANRSTTFSSDESRRNAVLDMRRW